jgi:hypothetical protein
MDIGVVGEEAGDLAIFIQRPVPLAGLGVIVGGLKKVALIDGHGPLSKI